MAAAPRRLAVPSAAACFLALGLVLRLVHYVWNHTIWFDEACLLVNVLGKNYAQLLGPLAFEQAAPPAYLWGLRSIAVLFGDHPYLWRLPSFVVSCLLLLLTAALVRRVLPPGPAAVVVGLAAFSDAYVWLGCCIKPYIIDALLATGLIYAYVSTSDWKLEKRLLLFLLAAPPLLCLSYPTLFLFAGVLTAFLPAVWRSRRLAPWAAYAGLIVAIVLTFAPLYFGPIHAQRSSSLLACWKNKFPDLSRPASVPGWLAGNGILVFHYCYNPVGAACVLLTAAGVWWCLRNRRLDWACLCVGPLAACVLASLARAHPLGNNRLILFTAPGIGLMSGLGVSGLWERTGRSPRALALLAVLLIGPEVGYCLFHLYAPWDQPDAPGSTHFIRQHRGPGDLIASDEPTWHYFFHGEERPTAALRAACTAGQRVWVPFELGSLEQRRQQLRNCFPARDWELRSETDFFRAVVFLVVRTANQPRPK